MSSIHDIGSHKLSVVASALESDFTLIYIPHDRRRQSSHHRHCDRNFDFLSKTCIRISDGTFIFNFIFPSILLFVLLLTDECRIDGFTVSTLWENASLPAIDTCSVRSWKSFWVRQKFEVESTAAVSHIIYSFPAHITYHSIERKDGKWKSVEKRANFSSCCLLLASSFLCHAL